MISALNSSRSVTTVAPPLKITRPAVCVTVPPLFATWPPLRASTAELSVMVSVPEGPMVKPFVTVSV
jgi:hypothetical protein